MLFPVAMNPLSTTLRIGFEGTLGRVVALTLAIKDGAVRFEVHAKPRAKQSRILGTRGDSLEVALAAPPVDGAANAELVRLLAETLGVPRRSVVLVRGETAQRKLVAVSGLSADLVAARLAAATE